MDGYSLTERLRSVLGQARVEAMRAGHQHVGPEHMLIALVRGNDPICAGVLATFRVDASAVEREVIRRLTPSEAVVSSSDLPYTSRAKKVLELAMSEARHMGHSSVENEHLLLGLVREGQSVAAESLAAFGVALDRARDEVRRLGGEDVVASGREWLSDLAQVTRQLADSLADVKSPRTPEDILLAVLSDDGGARHVLEVQGVDLVALSDEIDARDAGVRAGTSIRMLFAAAMSEQRFLGDCALASHHILLAYLALRPAHGYRALSDRGVTHASVRALAEQIFG